MSEGHWHEEAVDAGLATAAQQLTTPCMIVLECRDGLLLADREGIFPVAWTDTVDGLLPAWNMCGSPPVLVAPDAAGVLAELADAGRRVLVVDQEGAANLGGQAFWSFGGLLFADSPEQRRMGIKDSLELARQDWMGSAGFDRPEDHWPKQWAHAYVDFASGEKRSWLRERGHKIFPLVGWAERGGYDARGHGNSVPRFHITWGTGPEIVDVFARRLRGVDNVTFAQRHRVDELIVEDGAVVGVRGAVLEPTGAVRGVASSRNTVGEFEFRLPDRREAVRLESNRGRREVDERRAVQLPARCSGQRR